jgi:hypothetical protein
MGGAASFLIDCNALSESIFGEHCKEILGFVQKGNFLTT